MAIDAIAAKVITGVGTGSAPSVAPATGAEAGGGFDTKTSDDVAARRDGNTVQVDRELLNMTRSAGEFARAQTALAAKFRLVRYAINEAR